MKTLDPVLDAFAFHDQEGLPLAFAITAARDKGLRVNLAAFACDAFAAGWSDEKLRQVLEAACCDAGIPFKWDEFRERMAALYTLAAEGIDHPECWGAMKRYLARASVEPHMAFVTDNRKQKA